MAKAVAPDFLGERFQPFDLRALAGYAVEPPQPAILVGSRPQRGVPVPEPAQLAVRAPVVQRGVDRLRNAVEISLVEVARPAGQSAAQQRLTFPLDRTQQSVERVGEFADALVQQLGGRAVQRNAHIFQRLERCLGRGQVGVPVIGQRRRSAALTAECLEGLARHGVDCVRADQFVHVQGWRIVRVLGTGARPQQALRARTLGRQGLPARGVRECTIDRVGDLGVGDRHGAAQAFQCRTPLFVRLGVARAVESAVDQRIDPTHEEAGDARHPAQVAARPVQRLQPVQIGAGYRLVRRDREQQGHVDVDTLADQRRNRGDAGRRGRHLDHHVGPRHLNEQPARFVERRLRVVRQIRRDLQADVPIDAVRISIDRREHVRGHLNVLHGQAFVDFQCRRRAGFDQRAQGLLVVGAAAQRLLEDSRVGRDAAQPVVLDHRAQITGCDEAAPDVVVPDALAQSPDDKQRILHGPCTRGVTETRRWSSASRAPRPRSDRLRAAARTENGG